MLSFVNDYCEGMHPAILEQFTKINFDKQTPYGDDKYCKSAKDKIRKAAKCPDADVWFLAGGTQTNQVAIDSFLKPYEGVVAAKTAHVAMHESGAIEYTGHKVLELPSHNGKIKADELEALVKNYYADENYEHMVTPGMVYITHPTELGTLYSTKELKDIHKVCQKYKMPLYIDGARLAEALAADPKTGLAEIAANCEAFYIGGNKCGALFGEALVFTKKNTPKRFVSIIKQHGALLAKGWVVGLSFDVMFTDSLYIKGGQNAVDCAKKLRSALKKKGYKLYAENPTNQVFVIMENKAMKALAKKVKFSFWENYDANHTIIRFVTSWATKMEDIDKLIALL